MNFRFASFSIPLLLLISCGSSKPMAKYNSSATSSPWLLGFEKTEINPIMRADASYTFLDPVSNKKVNWQKADVFNPGAIVKNDTVFLFFRAEDNPDAILGGRTSRIGLAYSTNGVNFIKYPKPVLFPDNDAFAQWDQPGGIEDPRIVETPEGTYIMVYTSWNTDVARLSSATSTDLKHWTKQGPVFEEAYDGRFLDVWSKSGSIVTELKDGRLIAKKINGKYLMYWGELFVNLATSSNGTDWEPTLTEHGALLHSFKPTLNEFDSHLTEPGPPALFTEAGILLLYNGKNLSGEGATSEYPEGTYCGGQVLFNKNEPSQMISRLESPFICPSLPHEVSGQYKAGTTFIEGLVYFKNKWFLYYGTADSMVGLAVKE